MSSFKELVKNKGLTAKGKSAWGNYRGYLVTVLDKPKAKGLHLTALLPNVNALAEAEQFIRRQKEGGIKILQHQVNMRDLIVWIETNRDDYKMMEHLLEHLINLLTAVGAKGVGYCAHCGEPILTDGSVVTINDVMMEMHNACIARHNDALDAAREEVSSKGNIFTGILGALLGGIVGSIPWAIASYFGWFVGWLGFLIGIAAKKGYEILKGKTCRLKGVVVIAATVLCVILAEFIAVGVSLALDPEIGIPIWEGIGLTFYMFAENEEVMGAMLGDIALGLLFAGLGIFSLARDIFSETSHKAGKAFPVK